MSQKIATIETDAARIKEKIAELKAKLHIIQAHCSHNEMEVVSLNTDEGEILVRCLECEVERSFSMKEKCYKCLGPMKHNEHFHDIMKSCETDEYECAKCGATCKYRSPVGRKNALNNGFFI